jgi:hypothetical protein
MTDVGLKNLLGFLLRNKDTAVSLLENFKPEDVEKGILAIPEGTINRDIKMLIMDKAAPYLNDYELLFLQDSIFVDMDVDGKQLGRLKAKYMLTITQLDFRENTHRVSFSYKEDVMSEGNFMQSMAIKAAGLKGSYLQVAAEMMKLDFIEVGKDSVTINLDMLKFMKKIPPALNISYVSSEDGILKLKFHI